MPTNVYHTTAKAGEHHVTTIVRLLTEMGANIQAAGSHDMERLFGPGGQGDCLHLSVIASDGDLYVRDADAITLRKIIGDPKREVCVWHYSGQRVAYATKNGEAWAIWAKPARDINQEYFDGGVYGDVVPKPWGNADGESLAPSEIQSEWERERRELAERKESARLTVLDMIERGDARVKLSASGKTALLMEGGQELGRVCIRTPITPENVGGIDVAHQVVEMWGATCWGMAA